MLHRFLAVILALAIVCGLCATAYATGCGITYDPVVGEDGSVSYYDPRHDHRPPAIHIEPIYFHEPCPTERDCYLEQTPCPQKPKTCAPTACQIEAAGKEIRCKSTNVLDLLDRELAGTGWTRMKAKRILSKSGRVIYGDTSSGVWRKCKFTKPGAAPVRFVNEELELEITAYIVIRTPDSSKKVCSGRNYYVLFTTNFNTGKSAASYNDSWLISSDTDLDAETAVVEFVNWLVSEGTHG